jgi:hypothetical protein
VVAVDSTETVVTAVLGEVLDLLAELTVDMHKQLVVLVAVELEEEQTALVVAEVTQVATVLVGLTHHLVERLTTPVLTKATPDQPVAATAIFQLRNYKENINAN